MRLGSVFGGLLVRLGGVLGRLEASWKRLGGLLGPLGGVLGRLGTPWRAVGASWRRRGGAVGVVWSVLGRLGGVLEALWGVLGDVWEASWYPLGRASARASEASEARGAQACSTKQTEEKRWNNDKEANAKEQREGKRRGQDAFRSFSFQRHVTASFRLQRASRSFAHTRF